MDFNAYGCSCVGKMREGRHDFIARVVDEIIVIKDVLHSFATPAARSSTRWRYQERSMRS